MKAAALACGLRGRSGVAVLAVRRAAAHVPSLGRADARLLAAHTSAMMRIALRRPDGPRPAAFDRHCADLATLCASEEIPLADIVRACQSVTSTVLAQLWARCPPGDLAAARAVATRVVHDSSAATERVSVAYLAAIRSRMHDSVLSRRAARDLLDGRVPQGDAQAAGGYLVMVLKTRQGEGGAAATRLQTVRVGDAPLPHAIRRNDLLVLAPLLHSGPSARSRGEAAFADVLAATADLLSTPVGVYGHARRVHDVPRVVARAMEMAPMAMVTAEPNSLVATGELLLDHALDRDPESAALIAARLAPLHGEPGLIETLRVFYDQGLDRNGTAAALHVHRATLAHRLKRIQQLTDTSPTSVVGIKLFSTALSLIEGTT